MYVPAETLNVPVPVKAPVPPVAVTVKFAVPPLQSIPEEAIDTLIAAGSFTV